MRGQADSRGAAESPPVIAAESFEQAVALARQAARPGLAIVLSPACASYDMFDNYEQRGLRFVELLKNTR